MTETLDDPGFIAEAEKTQLEIDPMTGQEIEKMLAKAYAAPKDHCPAGRRTGLTFGAERAVREEG